jgi:hypothetical protein
MSLYFRLAEIRLRRLYQGEILCRSRMGLARASERVNDLSRSKGHLENLKVPRCALTR